MERKKICHIGVGLIGGSLAIQLHEKKISSKLIGVDANPEHAQESSGTWNWWMKHCHWMKQLLQSDVIILAIPVDTWLHYCPQVLDKIDKQIVIDLGSTKSQLIECCKRSSEKGKICSHAPDVGYGIQRSAGGGAWRI